MRLTVVLLALAALLAACASVDRTAEQAQTDQFVRETLEQQPAP